MSRREDRTQRRVRVVRHNRPPAGGRFARRPGPNVDGCRVDGWRARLPAALRRPLAWQAPVAGRAMAGAGRAAATATRTLRDRLRRGMPQTLAGRLLAAVAAIGLFAGATWATTHSALLDVDHIRVSGGTVVSPEQAVTGAGLRRGQPMASVDPAAAEQRLRSLPWVDTAEIDRVFPNTVRVHLTERAAVAAVPRPTGGWVVLDRTGRVLADRPDRPAGLPEVVGVGDAPAPGEVLPAARPALDVVTALPEPIRSSIETVNLAGESVTLHTVTLPTGGREIRIGPPTHLAAKAAALSVLLERVGDRSVAILDVRVPQAPVVVPTSPTAATSTPAPGRGVTAPAAPGKPKD